MSTVLITETATSPSETAALRIRVVVLRALTEYLAAYHDTSRPFDALAVSKAIADRAAKDLAALQPVAPAASPVQTVGIGPDDTAVIVDALDLWDRYLTAPHADIKRIRAALTGTVPS